MRIFLSAGEASGDHYGAKLIAALQQELRDHGDPTPLEFFGVAEGNSIIPGIL